MPKIAYIEKNFRGESRELIDTVNEIIDDYAQQGFVLTLRQCYYALVSRNIIPNTERSYKNLGSVISDARLAGLIDWAVIEDRTRFVRQNSHWSSPAEIIDACAEQYQIDKWVGQENYAEVWVEKDALVGVIEGACRNLDVPCFSCRGYTSQTAMWEASQRMLRRIQAGGYHPPQGATICYVLHLGDHDPSGIDMSHDIQERLHLFMGAKGQTAIVKRIALTMGQVKKYNCPPNPAKVTDSRSPAYISKYGRESWELDALEPRVLVQLVVKEVGALLDPREHTRREKQEKRDRRALQKIARSLKERGKK